MKTGILLAATLLLLLPGKAGALGNCPEGMYPISAPGVMGCAPLPQVQPRGPRWEPRWGAIASDFSGSGLGGYSLEMRSKRTASRQALKYCRAAGGKECKVTITYSNTCIFIATPFLGGRSTGGNSHAVWGGDKMEAERSAIKTCGAEHGVECRITYSGCSLPVLVEG